MAQAGRGPADLERLLGEFEPARPKIAAFESVYRLIAALTEIWNQLDLRQAA